MLSPVELLPTRENLVALNVLSFLSARLNPAAVNLLVLPPTICRASPKNHSNSTVHHALVWQADTLQRRKYRASKALHSKIGLLSPLLQLINSVLH
jgi:hypothetical protein